MSTHAKVNWESHRVANMLEDADYLEFECGENIDLVCLRLGINRDQLEQARGRRARGQRDPDPAT